MAHLRDSNKLHHHAFSPYVNGIERVCKFRTVSSMVKMNCTIRHSDAHVNGPFSSAEHTRLYDSALLITPDESVGCLPLHRQLPFMHKRMTH